MNTSKYTVKYFYDNLPAWKRKKDSFFLQIFFRPLSFITASFCAKCGISANTVSYVSGIVALAACALYFPSNYYCHLAGAILINVWLLMDCTDGNLARSVKKQPFGIFADAISSYMLVGFMSTFMAYSVYTSGGIIFEAGDALIILIGALASSSDTMMRLMYHKYEQAHSELVSNGIMPEENDDHNDKTKVGSWKVRVEHEMGIDGLLPVFILICTIFHAVDLAVLYCFCYYGCSFLAVYFLFVRKAIKNAKQYGDKMPQNSDLL